jgi:uncharacterized protein (DUF58 family)
MVREHEAPGRQALLLLVDPGLSTNKLTQDDRDSFERLLRLAAGIIRVWLRGADRWLGMAVAGDKPGFFQAQGGAGEGERAMLRALAVCEPSPVVPKWPEPPMNLPANLLTLRLHRLDSVQPSGRWGLMSRRDLPADKVDQLPWFEDVDCTFPNKAVSP